MSGVETYGGSCPVCSRGMLQKYESSQSGLMFDACVWCGYANGESDRVDLSPEQVWEAIFNAYALEGEALSADEKMKKLRNKLGINPGSPVDRSFWPVLFPVESGQASKYLSKSPGKEECRCDGFTLLHHGCRCRRSRRGQADFSIGAGKEKT